MFDGCFKVGGYGKIGFGDIDARVEIKDKFLELEWKSHGGNLSPGQLIAFKALTGKVKDWYTVIVVNGDPETMDVREFRYIRNGILEGWETASFDELYAEIKTWARWARYPGLFLEQAA